MDFLNRAVNGATAALSDVMSKVPSIGKIANQVGKSALALADSKTGGLASAVFGTNSAFGNVGAGVFTGMGRPDPLRNPYYTAMVIQEGVSPIRVVTPLPEDFNFSFGGEWSAPFEEGVIDNAKINMLSQMAGFKPATQSMTTQFWKGSSMSDITIPFQLVAINDAHTDVVVPLANLIRLSMPTNAGGGFFRAPGPQLSASAETRDAVYSAASNLGDAAVSVGGAIVGGGKESLQKATESAQRTADDVGRAFNSITFKNKISLTLGQFARFDSVVITNIDPQVKSLFDANGKPMGVVVNVTFRLHQTPFADDILKAFHMGSPI